MSLSSSCHEKFVDRMLMHTHIVSQKRERGPTEEGVLDRATPGQFVVR
jgi:hypothetical protein